eukprot:CAMPEP_0167832682 /NCGR_PEP_ID=MMETSP0112_2-20121227/14516_1 /TAXON_ID=91324 /ORGANISM="Lotharella globosa, Strain CCCM811" /LENGTH=191 /DNA_ID=CAMNT_0007737845 /DNA_START=127 /DNA_END=700 /DNA_ORIENTATION=+
MRRKELEGKDLPPTAKDNRPSQSLKRFREMVAYTKKLKQKNGSDKVTKEAKLAETDKLASKARAALMRETQAQVKRRRRLEKHKEKLAAKKKKRKSKTPSVDDDDEEGRANSSIADSKGDADADGANKKKKLRNRTNVTEAAPTFGEVAYRPPEFAARPKVKVMPLASTLSSESIEAKDSDEDNEEAVQAR